MFQNPFKDPSQMSLAEIQARKRIQNGLVGNMGNAPNIGTGVAQLAQGITMGIMRPKMEAAEQAKMAAMGQPQVAQVEPQKTALFGIGSNNRGLIDFGKIFGGK